MVAHSFILVLCTIATLVLSHFMKTIVLDSVQLRAQGIAYTLFSGLLGMTVLRVKDGNLLDIEQLSPGRP